jgi:hypothetical protein
MGRIAKRAIVGLLFSLFVPYSTVHGGDPPSAPDISKGACPFEGSAHGAWKVRKAIRVFAKPDMTLAATATPASIVPTITPAVLRQAREVSIAMVATSDA